MTVIRSRAAPHQQGSPGSGGSASHALPGADDITRVVLPNGIVVLSRANFNSPSVVVSGYLPAGALFEPDEKLGLAGFTAASLMRGSERRTFQETYDALESAGASLGISGGTHTAGFYGRALVEDLDLLLELLADSLRCPLFPPEYIERLRAQALTGLAIRAQDTEEMAGLAFDQILYAGHPYSRPEDGYPETIRAISREDVQAFHAGHYGPAGMVMVLVGAIDPQEGVDKISRYFGDWSNPAQTPPPALPPTNPLAATVRQNVVIPEKSQADVLIGAVGPSRIASDYLAALLANHVLGQFGMMGRLGELVREQSGLAYHVSSSLSGGMGPGPWYVSAGVDPGNVEQVLELCQAEIARLVAEPVEAQELEDSQANYIGRLPLSLESNGGVASALINIERYQLGLDYYRTYPARIGAIRREELLAAARRYLDPQRLGIAVAGSL